MTCDSVKEMLGPWLDGELDSDQSAEISAHVADCASCSAALEELRQLSASLRSPGLRWNTPAYLEARVVGAVRESARRDSPAPQPFWRWAALAACLLLGALLTWTLLPARSGNSARQLIAQDVVASHVRSLLGNHLLDVPSTDRHTVKPWFDGKLDFSPNVKDFGTQGFRLVGGRLDYIDGRPVAALVFQRRLHMINLFLWPSNQPDSPPQSAPPQKGYNVIHWDAAGMTYWAVADIPAEDLQQLARLYRE